LGRLSMKTVSSPLAPLFSISASSSLPSAAAPSSSSSSLASSAASSISPSSWTNSSSSSAAFFLDVDLDLPLYAEPLAGAEAFVLEPLPDPLVFLVSLVLRRETPFLPPTL
jgi:hypothetical protein